MNTSFRLDSVFPDLAEGFRRATPSRRRQAALTACVVAVSEAELEADAVNTALERIRHNVVADSALRNQLKTIAAQFDDEYFRLDEEGDEATKAEALRLFSKARAASALAFALSEDTMQLHEALYEAIAALGDPTELVKSIEQVMS